MKKLFLIFLTVLIYSCNSGNTEEENIFINKIYIEKISKIDSIIPSQFARDIYFVKTKKDQIGKLNIYNLFECYNSKYKDKYVTFNIFLYYALNNFIKIENNCIENQIELNKKILKDYSNISFEKFLKKYSYKYTINKQVLIKLNPVSETILYVCYLNGYIGVFSDDLGIYKLRKI